MTEEARLLRKVEEKVKKAIFDYGLIVDGDRILVGLSGGKDSLALLELLGRRARIFRPRFELVAAHIVMENIPYRSDEAYLRSVAAAYDVPLLIETTRFDASTDVRGCAAKRFSNWRSGTGATKSLWDTIRTTCSKRF